MSCKIIMLLDNPFVSDVRVEKEINSLIGAGFLIDLVCEKHPKLPDNETRGELTIVRILDPIYKKPFHKDYKKYLLEIAKYIITLEGKAIHCHDYHMLNFGFHVKQLNPSIKLVYDSHEYLKGWPMYIEANTFLNKIKGYFVWKKNVIDEALGIKTCDHIFTVSKGISDQLKTDHKLNVFPTILRNFPITRSYDFSEDNYFRKKYGLGKDVTVIVHSGNIYMDKIVLPLLIEYVSSQADLALIFMGNSSSFLNLQKKFSVCKNIFFHDYYDQKRNIELMCSADIGLCYVNLRYKSHYLTFANRYMEYNSAGLSVFSSKQKEIEHLAIEMKNTIFFNDKATSIINCLKKHKRDVISLKSNAKKNASKFIWENESKSLINYYANLA